MKQQIPKTVILLGPPGSGKDTQAFALAKHFGYFVLVTGDLFRAEIAHGSPIGKKMQEVMDQGGLLPAEMVHEVLGEELARHKSTIAEVGLLFDGFPRLKEEIRIADALIDRYQLRPDLAIVLSVEDEALLTRLAARGRPDDAPEVARHRIAVYKRETEPVVEHYRKKKKLLTIDGNPLAEEVTKNLLSEFEKFRT